jgi:pimeloyl-ACP methyl ester carboxylesterase
MNTNGLPAPVWGGNDVVFPTKGAAACQRDLKTAELHVFETGHFALETHGIEIGGLMNFTRPWDR